VSLHARRFGAAAQLAVLKSNLTLAGPFSIEICADQSFAIAASHSYGLVQGRFADDNALNPEPPLPDVGVTECFEQFGYRDLDDAATAHLVTIGALMLVT
jgi:hypothetical protein